jgi:topoisomerase-4 subunit A
MFCLPVSRTLLVNGSEGIAVGIATSIPPHNLKEVTQAVCYRIKHPNCDVDDLIATSRAGFPDRRHHLRIRSLKDIYRTGHGRVVASRCEITRTKRASQQIIVSEIPYQVNKSELVKSIDKIRHDKTIPGIDEVRDETDKDGLRIAIDFKDDCQARSDFGLFDGRRPNSMTGYTANMMAIVDGHPKVDGSFHLLRLLHPASARRHHPPSQLPPRQRRGPPFDCEWLHQRPIDLERSWPSSSPRPTRPIPRSTREGLRFQRDQAEAIVMMPLYKLSHTDITSLEQEKASLGSDFASSTAYCETRASAKISSSPTYRRSPKNTAASV